MFKPCRRCEAFHPGAFYLVLARIAQHLLHQFEDWKVFSYASTDWKSHKAASARNFRVCWTSRDLSLMTGSHFSFSST
jgi:hypothetical protein